MPRVDIGPLPAANGLSIAPASGGVEENTLAHGGEYSMTLALNGKHTGQATVYDALCVIHEHLEKFFVYPTAPTGRSPDTFRRFSYLPRS